LSGFIAARGGSQTAELAVAEKAQQAKRLRFFLKKKEKKKVKERKRQKNQLEKLTPQG
jgi:hypothetical protein